ncbi:MAG: LrgB family protein [Cytophagales bacterium]|nr:LrgB family protein [Cytophagales bacterium]
MNDFFQSEVFGIFLTLGVYFLAQKLYKRFSYFFLNPILITIGTIILILISLDIDYAVYNKGGKLISLFLSPAVVALAIPLNRQFKLIRKNSKAILFSMFSGSLAGILSVMLIAYLLGGSELTIISLAPKSVTTPIAMSISEQTGGLPSLTAVFVMIAGILGSIAGLPFLRLIGIKKPESIGLAVGTASHGLGTASLAAEGEQYTAYSGLALSLCGIITAGLTPLVLEWIMKWLR